MWGHALSLVWGIEIVESVIVSNLYWSSCIHHMLHLAEFNFTNSWVGECNFCKAYIGKSIFLEVSHFFALWNICLDLIGQWVLSRCLIFLSWMLCLEFVCFWQYLMLIWSSCCHCACPSICFFVRMWSLLQVLTQDFHVPFRQDQFLDRLGFWRWSASYGFWNNSEAGDILGFPPLLTGV